MYKSPIELTCGPLQFREAATTAAVKDMTDYMNEQQEKILMEATRTVGISIDKEELVKAINYDRHQYEQGYDDGFKDGLQEGSNFIDWISCEDKMPSPNVSVFYYGVDPLGPVWGMGKWNPIKDKWELTIGYLDKSVVTHWMYRTTPKDKE